jgi:hypothetical protein
MDFLTKVLAAIVMSLIVAGVAWLLRQGTKTQWLAAWKSRMGAKRMRLLRNWGPLFGLALSIAAIATYAYIQNRPDYKELVQARSGFAAMNLPQAIAHCLALPNPVRYDAPRAFAWQPGVLDWYVLEGADSASMRHYACDGASVRTGERYERVLLKRVASEGVRLGAAMEQNLFEAYAGFSEANVQALEVAEDPQTRTALERRWLASGGAQLSSPIVNELPILLGVVPASLATSSFPDRTLRVSKDWSERPDAVFALLDKHVQAAQQVAELYFDQEKIQITVVGTIDASAQPTTAFGRLNFDAYGIADHSAWAPVAAERATCKRGRSFSEVKALFAQQPKLDRMLYAWFDCDPNKEHNDIGDWYFRDVRTRKEFLPPGRR